MSVKIIFKDAKTFAKVLNYCSEFDKTTSIVVLRPDCFHMQTMDAGKSSISDLKLPPQYFETYEVNTAEIQMGLPLEYVYDFIKNIKHETLTMTMTEGSPNINLTVASDDGFEASLSIKTIDVDSETFNIPPMSPNCEFEMDIATLKKWASFLPKKGSVRFAPEKSKIRVESNTDHGTFKLHESVNYNEFKNPRELQIGSVNMDKIYKLMQFGVPVWFKMVNMAPLECSIDMGNGVRLYSYFAPMIEDEDIEM